MRPRTVAYSVTAGALVLALVARWHSNSGPRVDTTAVSLPAGRATSAPDEGAGRAGSPPRLEVAERRALDADESPSRSVTAAPASRAHPTRTVAVVDAENRAVPAELLVFSALEDEQPRITSRTDNAGKFEARLAAGEHVVALAGDGRCGACEVTESGDDVRVHVFGPVSLRGRVVDLDTGEVIPAAVVRATWLDMPEAVLPRLAIGGARERVVVADATGSFDLAPFRAGLYRLDFSAEGYDHFVAEQHWPTARDWDMGAITLEAIGELTIQLVGIDPSALPWVSAGHSGERTQVDAEGRAAVRVPRWAEPQHFSIWLHDASMMNVYRRGTLDEVKRVEVRVGGGRSLEVSVEGEPSAEVAALGLPSIRARYSPEPGTHAEWNRDLAAGAPHRTDCIDAVLVAVDLVALDAGWPNVIYSTTATMASTGVTEVTLRYPNAARWLKVLGADGAPLGRGAFVELRRPHDATRWIASGYTDAEGRVIWPEVLAPELYCGGALEGGGHESFFIDLALPNAPGTAPLAPLALASSAAHRVRVVDAGEGVAGARVRVLGRHTDQSWALYVTDADGWTPTFLITEGSAVDYAVEESRASGVSKRIAAEKGETIVAVRGE
jgi:hypothetical protein